MSANGASPLRLSIETARQLLDFRGNGTSPISEYVAEGQLEGAVALHNILQDEGFAYLADEVGMGKTYVALGALALFRHFDPRFRVLIIAPRENIQKKWVKELRNFAAWNVRFPDLRVKAIHGAPARATVMCQSLIELVRETAVDPDRDFFARLTSFSLPLGKDSEGWSAKRDQLREHLPWLDASLFDLRNRSNFKDNFARAVNCAIPVFDLVIFDEGHNLKGGYRSGAASRNRALALAFGRPSSESDGSVTGFTGYGPRARRVLFLSATPLENDYVQLWNQLDVFGFGRKAAVLRDPNAIDDEKRACAQRFLIRRVTTLPVADQRLTKNLYRREWRKGGVEVHDDALAVPDERQRLAVALVQKKVSEVLGAARFNNSFQIGMLASFESFLETARVRLNGQADGEESTFDDPDQAEDLAERLGVDVSSVNGLARSYRQRFGTELPHPKMDAVVDRLASAFTTGDKALVFVRRVASVKELRRKVEERYDSYLFERLRSELAAELQPALERVIERYRDERSRDTQRRATPVPLTDGLAADDESIIDPTLPRDAGGLETFFAWFFRGDGPGDRILSGATLQKRFSQRGSVYSTFFEDNHVAWLLGVRPGQPHGGVATRLAEYLGRPLSEVAKDLSQRAATHLRPVKKQPRRDVFLAFQRAAISILVEHPGDLRANARVVREERYASGEPTTRHTVTPPALGDWLEISTLFTEARYRPALRAALWPEPEATDQRAAFRTQELRRELLSAMVRLGHPFVDLYVLSINRIGRLELRAREHADEAGSDLITEFLDHLEAQAAEQSGGYTAYRELADAAANFDLIVTVNEPKVRDEALGQATTRFGGLLRAQQPVGGMFGQVSDMLVRQFRMPGYPRVLITTDLLQEGEDLHIFCSSVYHYGISWMPSSMEQRVGRVDRVSSQTDRRLTRFSVLPTGEQLLQVYYPHLRETVEVLQVERVLERLNRFLRLMHEDLGGHDGEERSLDITREILRGQRDIAQLTEPLQTAFPIRSEFLRAPRRALAAGPSAAAEVLTRFLALRDGLSKDKSLTWEDRQADNALLGTLHLRTRCQPFTLLLRSVDGRPAVRCVSPIGWIGDDLGESDVILVTRDAGVRVGAVYDERIESYNLAIEGDVLLGDPATDLARARWLLGQVTQVADRLEEQLLGGDQPMSTFRKDLELEVSYER